jgi:hypothetical protein
MILQTGKSETSGRKVKRKSTAAENSNLDTEATVTLNSNQFLSDAFEQSHRSSSVPTEIIQNHPRIIESIMIPSLAYVRNDTDMNRNQNYPHFSSDSLQASYGMIHQLPTSRSSMSNSIFPYANSGQQHFNTSSHHDNSDLIPTRLPPSMYEDSEALRRMVESHPNINFVQWRPTNFSTNLGQQ